MATVSGSTTPLKSLEITVNVSAERNNNDTLDLVDIKASVALETGQKTNNLTRNYICHIKDTTGLEGDITFQTSRVKELDVEGIEKRLIRVTQISVPFSIDFSKANNPDYPRLFNIVQACLKFAVAQAGHCGIERKHIGPSKDCAVSGKLVKDSREYDRLFHDMPALRTTNLGPKSDIQMRDWENEVQKELHKQWRDIKTQRVVDVIREEIQHALNEFTSYSENLTTVAKQLTEKQNEFEQRQNSTQKVILDPFDTAYGSIPAKSTLKPSTTTSSTTVVNKPYEPAPAPTKSTLKSSTATSSTPVVDKPKYEPAPAKSTLKPSTTTSSKFNLTREITHGQLIDLTEQERLKEEKGATVSNKKLFVQEPKLNPNPPKDYSSIANNPAETTPSVAVGVKKPEEEKMPPTQSTASTTKNQSLAESPEDSKQKLLEKMKNAQALIDRLNKKKAEKLVAKT